MPRPLPPFATVTESELRALWRQHRDPAVRRLILEIVRYRKVMAEIDHLYKVTRRAWSDHVGGDLVALHLLLQIMTEERQRLPDQSSSRGLSSNSASSAALQGSQMPMR